MTAKPTQLKKMALVVHNDLASLSAFQGALTAKDYVTIVARDLPTALLAITQHYFDVAIIASHLGEGGDGWPLAGVFHLVFPRAFVAVVTPSEPDVLTFQSAINNGVTELYQQTSTADEVVDSVLAQASTRRPSGSSVQ